MRRGGRQSGEAGEEVLEFFRIDRAEFEGARGIDEEADELSE